MNKSQEWLRYPFLKLLVGISPEQLESWRVLASRLRRAYVLFQGTRHSDRNGRNHFSPTPETLVLTYFAVSTAPLRVDD